MSWSQLSTGLWRSHTLSSHFTVTPIIDQVRRITTRTSSNIGHTTCFSSKKRYKSHTAHRTSMFSHPVKSVVKWIITPSITPIRQISSILNHKHWIPLPHTFTSLSAFVRQSRAPIPNVLYRPSGQQSFHRTHPVHAFGKPMGNKRPRSYLGSGPPPTLANQMYASPYIYQRYCTPHTTQVRGLFGVFANIRYMDKRRCMNNWNKPFVWFEEYRLGTFRADELRALFHAKRSGGIIPPRDPITGEQLSEAEYLNILAYERILRFYRSGLIKQMIVFNRFVLARTSGFMISVLNYFLDQFTRLLGAVSRGIRGRASWQRMFLHFFFWLIRYQTIMVARSVLSLFFRMEMRRVWTLEQLEQQMGNKVSGELKQKYPWPVKYSFSNYAIEFIRPLYDTFNVFLGAYNAFRAVVFPNLKRMWFHINDYKPYVGFMKFGALQWFLAWSLSFGVYMFQPFRTLDFATYAYKADFGHSYIALMTRAVLAQTLITMIEDKIIRIYPLAEVTSSNQVKANAMSQAYYELDKIIEQRCQNDPKYKQSLIDKGYPLTLEEFFGLDIDIPTDLTPEEQVIFILQQYTDFDGINKQMFRKLHELEDFTARALRVLYSLGLADETSWLNRLMGNISSPKTHLYSYRALLNIIGTRDGETDDETMTNEALLRALTRKFDLVVVPPSQDLMEHLQYQNPPYLHHFLKTDWETIFSHHDLYKSLLSEKYYPGGRPDTVNVLAGEKYAPAEDLKVTPFDERGYGFELDDTSGINIHGGGKFLLDIYLSRLVPFHQIEALDYEMVVLQRIKEAIVSLSRIHPEYNEHIPMDYDPFKFKEYIQGLLRFYGSNKAIEWENMINRDWFENETELLAPHPDIGGRKHAKWLWSTIVVCVHEKLAQGFASPMYYITGTCPKIDESTLRSRVDTTSRFTFRSALGRPDSDYQKRGLDYQLIDPYAEHYLYHRKSLNINPIDMDVERHELYNPARDEIHKPIHEDLGLWPNGKSILPFLGFNKYYGGSPMLSYLGMLATSTENLMSINRTVVEETFKYHPSHMMNSEPPLNHSKPKYLHSDGWYRNRPDPKMHMLPPDDQEELDPQRLSLPEGIYTDDGTSVYKKLIKHGNINNNNNNSTPSPSPSPVKEKRRAKLIHTNAFEGALPSELREAIHDSKRLKTYPPQFS